MIEALADLPSPFLITFGSRVSPGCMGNRLLGSAAGPASGATPNQAANEMDGFVFHLTAPFTKIYKAFWFNGATAGGNHSVAIYDEFFRKIAETASTAGAGNSQPQSVAFTPSPIILGPGTYYAVLSNSITTSGTFSRWICNSMLFYNYLGCWRQTSITVGSLPATATPARYASTNGGVGHFGLITRSNFDV